MKKLAKLLKLFAFTFVGLLLIASYMIAFDNKPEPFPEGSESAKWLENGQYKTKTAAFSLRDESRKTQPYQGLSKFDGAPHRDFDVSVWFPATLTENQHPLIVYSHALSSARNDVEYLASYLSSHGYIVLAGDFPLTKRNAPAGAHIEDVINQPDDLSFFLDTILSEDNELGKTFRAYIDSNKIAAMGLSLGGMTTTLAAYHPTKHDSRIKAAISLAGVSSMFGKKFYQDKNLPFLMIAGEHDAVLPHRYHAAPTPERINNSVLITIKGGTHIGFSDLAKYMRWMDNPDSMICAMVNWGREKKYQTTDFQAFYKQEKSWYPMLGTAEQGILLDDPSVMCGPESSYPEGINPLTQQMLTKVASLSFLESIFHPEKSRRDASQDFFNKTLAMENSAIRQEGSHLAE